MELLRELPGCVIVVSKCRAPQLAKTLQLFHREVRVGLPDLACRRRMWAQALESVDGVDADQVETLARTKERIVSCWEDA